MSLSASTPLNLKPRTSIDLDRVDLQDLMASGNGEMLARLDWDAKIRGDRSASRAIAGAHLRNARQIHAGVGRERWILQLAAANTDTVTITSVVDLAKWVESLRQGLTLARIEAMDFGHRKEGTLDNGFGRAADRLNRIQQNVELAIEGNLFNSAELIRDISFCGDLYLCDAIAGALFNGGDNSWGHVVRAAHIRRLHDQPTVALELLEDVLSTSCNPGALASKSGSLCDIGQRSVDGTPYFEAAMEATLLRLAVDPSIHGARTGARSFKLGGRPDLQAHCLTMWRQFDFGVAPESFASMSEFFSQQATMILVKADRRDLAELQLRKQWTTADWARATRVHADATTGMAVAR